ncbi:MAG: morn variant repeat-containing protein [Bacteroidetes bacterium]|nr:MAG: morn variant repeat-containing protein [Bacteroidota bacterium]
MNKRIILPALAGVFFLAACSNEPVADKKKDTADSVLRITTTNSDAPKPGAIMFEGDTVTHYPNGVIQVKGYMGGGMRQGQWFAFFENGEVQSECQYKNNLKHGKSVVYREGGKKYWEGYYNMDAKVGKWKFWDDAGKMTEKDYGGTLPTGK